MTSKNLTQKQFNWLLSITANDTNGVGLPWEIRMGAYRLLKSVGYNREYNEYERIELNQLRKKYIEWEVESEKDDLPF